MGFGTFCVHGNLTLLLVSGPLGAPVDRGTDPGSGLWEWQALQSPTAHRDPFLEDHTDWTIGSSAEAEKSEDWGSFPWRFPKCFE